MPYQHAHLILSRYITTSNRHYSNRTNNPYDDITSSSDESEDNILTQSDINAIKSMNQDIDHSNLVKFETPVDTNENENFTLIADGDDSDDDGNLSIVDSIDRVKFMRQNNEIYDESNESGHSKL